MMRIPMKRVYLVYDENHRIVFRRSEMSKKAWLQALYIFHINEIDEYEMDKVTSITIEGTDDNGQLMVSIMVEE